MFHYWKTPHATTVLTPAKFLLETKPKTTLDLIHLDISAHKQDKQYAQQEAKNGKPPSWSSRENNQIYVHNFQIGDKWLSETVLKTWTLFLPD